MSPPLGRRVDVAAGSIVSAIINVHRDKTRPAVTMDECTIDWTSEEESPEDQKDRINAAIAQHNVIAKSNGNHNRTPGP